MLKGIREIVLWVVAVVLLQLTVNAQLNGTYTIGGSTPDFTTFSDAIDTLNSKGVSGAVTFNIRSGTYTEQLFLDSIKGSSSANTVTFQKDPASSTSPIIQFAASSSVQPSVIELDSTDYVTFKGLDIRATGTSYANVFLLKGFTKKITIESCTITGVISSNTTHTHIASLPGSSHQTDSLLIRNNTFSKAYSFIDLFGAATSNPEKGNTIENNTGTDFRNRGFYITNQQGLTIKNNSLTSAFATFSQTGIYCQGLQNGNSIFNNQLVLKTSGSSRGFTISGATGSSVDRISFYNNTYRNPSANSSVDRGLDIRTCHNIDIYHNTSVSNSSSSFNGNPLFVSGGTNLNIKNNNLVSLNGGFVVNISSNPSAMVMDYNNLYSATGSFGYFNNLTATTFANWKSFTGGDANSVSMDPQFVSALSLKPDNGFMNDLGTQIPSVNTDINGTSRSSVSPDIGAFEFTGTKPPMAGVYTIGGTTPNFTTVSDAVAEMKTRTIDSTVTFHIRQGTYNESVYITAITGMADTTLITFMPDPANTSDVIIQSNSSVNRVLGLLNCKYVTFKGITLSSTDANYPLVVNMFSNNSNIMIDSCIINSSKANTSNASYNAAVIGDGPNSFVNSSFTNNKVAKGNYGIRVRNNSGTVKINNNTFTDFGAHGVYFLGNNDTVEIKNNRIISNTTIGTTGGNGIYVEKTNESTIEKNRVIMRATTSSTGLFLKNSSYSTVVNNTFNLKANTSLSQVGAEIHTVSTSKIFFNSIAINSTLSTSKALRIVNSTGLDLKNNICKAGSGYAIEANGTTSAIILNNNNYFTSGSNLGNWFSAQSSLSALTNASGETNAVNVNPNFINDTLFPGNAALSGAGIVISGFSTDILDSTRKNPPSIGAFKFSIPPMRGVYTIGGTTPDYSTISAAVSDLNAKGIDSNVVFYLRQGSYTEQVKIDSVNGATSTHWVKFMSDPANSVKPNIGHASSSTNPYVLLINGADHISFSNIDFARTGSNNGSAVMFEGQCDSISFDSCKALGNAGYSFYSDWQGNISTTRDELDYLNISNCEVNRNIYLQGNVTVSDSATFRNNQVTDSEIQLRYFNNATVENNNTGGPIGYSYSHNGVVKSNRAGGLTIYRSNNAEIINNSLNRQGYWGLYFSGSSGNNVYFNTVKTINEAALGFDGNTVTNSVFKNNIFYSESQNGACLELGTSATNIYDYNAYYAQNDTLLETSSGAFHLNLSSLQSLGRDTNSLVINPYFTADTLLKPYRVALNNKGVSISGITTDIENELRGSTPDIGAYEFDGIDYNLAVDSIKVENLCSGDQKVEVLVKNNSDSLTTTFYLKINSRLKYGAVPTTKQREFAINLPKNDSVWVLVDTLSLIADSSYVYNVQIDSVQGYLDNAPENNFKELEFKAFTDPVAQITVQSACIGDSLKLFGSGGDSLQWYGPNSFADTGKTVFRTNTLMADAGDYKLIATNGNGCVDSVIKTVAFDSIPLSNLPADTAICQNESFTLAATVNSAYSYSWNVGSSVPQITIDSAHQYILTTTDVTGCSGKDTFNLSLNNLPAVGLTAALPSLCTGQEGVQLTQGTPSGGVYSGTIISNDSAIAGGISGLFPIRYSYTDANGCTSDTLSNIKVNTTPIVSVSPLNNICLNADADTIIEHSPKGGKFVLGGGVTDTTFGLFDASIAGVGNHTIQYTYVDTNGCYDTVSQQIEVVDTLAISLTDTSLCENVGLVKLNEPSQLYGNLSGRYSGSSAIAGSWYYPAVKSGKDTLMYSVTDTNNCISSINRIITLNIKPLVSKTDTGICENAEAFGLDFALPSGGSYWGTGVNNDSLNPALLSVGIDTVFYNYTSATNGCSDTTFSIVSVLPKPVVQLNLPDSVKQQCIGDIAVTLSGHVPFGGYYSGNGVDSATSSFSSTLATADTHLVTYHVLASNGCSSSASDSIIVHALPQVSLLMVSNICVNDSNQTLNGGIPFGGFYTGTAIDSNGYFEPAKALVGQHTIRYSYIDSATTCLNTSSSVLQVDSVTPITLGLIPDYCINHSIDSLTQGKFNSGTYSYSGKGVFNNNKYDPVLAGIGKDTVEYSFTNLLGCTSKLQQEVIVNDTSVTSVNVPASLKEVCKNEPAFKLNFATPVGGTFQSLAALNNGTFSPVNANVGLHNLVYTYQNNFGCVSKAYDSIRVNTVPVVSMQGASFCQNQGLQKLNLGQPTGGKYTGLGMSNDSIFNPALAGAGNKVIRYTFSNAQTGCTAFKDSVITVKAKPTVSFSTMASICANKADFNIVNGANNGARSYYLGTGIVDTAQGTFSPALAGSGAYTIQFIGVGANACTDTATQILQVDTVPIVKLDSLPALCVDATSIQLTQGNPKLNGSGLYIGNGVSANSFNPFLAKAGVHAIIYQFTDLNGCVAEDTNTIQVNALPVITPKTFPSYCQFQDSISLLGALPAGGVYSGNAFIDTASKKMALDSVGTWNLIYTVTDTNGCVNSDMQSVLVRNLPVVSLNFANSLCLNAGAKTISGGLPLGNTGVYKASGLRGNTYYVDSVKATSDSLWYIYTDRFGCTDSALQVIQLDTVPIMAKNALPELCEGNDSLNLASFYFPQGGVFTGAKIQNSTIYTNTLTPNAYPITYGFTDSNSCTETVYDTLYIRPKPLASLTPTQSICLGDKVTLTASGGSSYSWNTGDYSASIQVNPDTTTVYSVEVANSYHCSSKQTTVVIVRENFSVFTSSTPASCGKPNGTGNVSVLRGKSPFNYLWSNGTRTTKSSSLIAGNYSITVTDANGCTQFANVDVSNTGGPSLSLDSIKHVTCYAGVDAYLSVNAATGSSLLWSNGSKKAALNNISAGLYTVEASDSNGCKTSRTFEITEPTAIKMEANLILPSCDSSNGEIEIVSSGGVGNHTYNWPSLNKTTDTVKNLSAGIYELAITDGNSCTVSHKIELENQNGPDIQLDSIKLVNCGNSDGSIFINTLDSVKSYVWTGGNTNQDLTNVGIGEYSITATDTNNCKTIKTYSLDYLKPNNGKLCFVSFDSTSLRNKVVWDTTGTSGVSQFEIWRESAVKGKYQLVETVGRNTAPQIIDSSLNIKTQVGKYQLVSVNACGQKSVPNTIHKSILLSTEQISENVIQLTWNAYSGVAANGYYLFRYSSINGFELIDSTASNVFNYNDFSFPKQQKNLFYFVMLKGTGSCAANGSIVSNYSFDYGLGYNVGLATQNSNWEYKVYPNPASNQLNIQFDFNSTQPTLIRLFDSKGAVINQMSINRIGNGQIQQIDLLEIPNGLYYLQVINNGIVKTTSVVVNQ